MAHENFGKFYPITMKISWYLPLYEDTSAIYFGSDRLIRLAVHGPKMGVKIIHNM